MKKLIFFLLFICNGFASAQWTEQTSGITTLLYSVSSVDDNVVWACGDGGKVLRTVNSGVLWTTVTSPNSAIGLFTIQGFDALTAVVGGSDASAAYVYKTVDGGATWTLTFSQPGGFVNALKKLEGLPGLVGLQGDPVGGRWTLFFSLDDGSTWDSSGFYIPAAVGEAGWNNSYYGADPADRAWFGTNSTKVIEYFGDGTFTNRPTTGETNTYAIWGNDNSRLMTGGSTKMLYTVDEGATWTDVGAIGAGDISGIVGGNTSIWYYTRGSSVYYSANNGTSWSTDYTTTGIYFHMTLSPLGRYIWAVRDNGGISRKEIDILLPVELSSFVSNVVNRDVNLSWSTVSETDNAGFEIQRTVSQNSFTNEWTKIGFINGNGSTSEPKNYTFTDRGLNTGKYIYRLKQIDYNGNYKYHSLDNEVVVGVPVSFSLSQNYPNPFNPSTKINFDIPNDGQVDLRVYDISGKEVGVLVNEFKTAGFYTVTFNNSNISSGVYFYTLKSGNLVTTKKMTLLK